MGHPLHRMLLLTVATALVAVLATWVLADAEPAPPGQAQAAQALLPHR